MKETGIVKSASGTTCLVSVRRKTACGDNCATCKAMCEAREQICEAENLIGAKAGDKVSIELDSKNVLKSAFLVYILPLFAFLTVFLTADSRGINEPVSAVLAGIGAVIIFVPVFIYDKKARRVLPKVTEIL